MALSEGTSTLPNDAATTPNCVFGPYDGSAFWLQRSPAAGDALAAKYVAGVGLYIYNGTTVDRMRSIVSAEATTGIGVPASGPMGYYSTGGQFHYFGAISHGDGNTGFGPTYALNVAAMSYLYNGATPDRQRGNTTGTLLASQARTANDVSPTQTNHNARGVRVYIDVTAKGAAPSITATIQEIDPLSSNIVNVITSSAITAIGTYVVTTYPGTTNAVNKASDALPRSWRVAMTHGNGDSITYSVSYCLIV
jgi:hypothetical protein